MKAFPFSVQSRYRRQQQDYLRVIRDIHRPDSVFAVVADGHGRDGFLLAHIAVERAADCFRYHVKAAFGRREMSEVFRCVHERVVFLQQEQQLRGGTTLTLLYTDGSNVIIANVGDSPAGLITRDGRRKTLTEDHSVKNDQERSRVLQSHRLTFDSEKGGFLIPRGDDRFANFKLSRAIGDLSLTLEAFAPMPHVMVRSLPEETKYLLAVTDGVTDTIYRQSFPELFWDMLVQDRMDTYGGPEVFQKLVQQHAIENASGVLIRVA